MSLLIRLTTNFDMKLQVFIHGIDVVEDVLNYPGDDAHSIRVMEVPLQTESTSRWEVKLSMISNIKRSSEVLVTSMVCVFPDDVCPYAKIVPLYPSRTSTRHQTGLCSCQDKKKAWLLLLAVSIRLNNKPNESKRCLTFYNLLGAGVVHLFLCRVRLKHSVEHVRFALEWREEEWEANNTTQSVKPRQTIM